MLRYRKNVRCPSETGGTELNVQNTKAKEKESKTKMKNKIGN